MFINMGSPNQIFHLIQSEGPPQQSQQQGGAKKGRELHPEGPPPGLARGNPPH